MKFFIIESRRGFVSLPETIGSYHFPISFSFSSQFATQFPFRLAAQKMIKKYHLENYPYWAHIEEIES
jgi:hypothetical protein